LVSWNFDIKVFLASCKANANGKQSCHEKMWLNGASQPGFNQSYIAR
jgi:hypothetical protein